MLIETKRSRTFLRTPISDDLLCRIAALIPDSHWKDYVKTTFYLDDDICDKIVAWRTRTQAVYQMLCLSVQRGRLSTEQLMLKVRDAKECGLEFDIASFNSAGQQGKNWSYIIVRCQNLI